MDKEKKGILFTVIGVVVLLALTLVVWFFFQTSSTGDPQKDYELYLKYKPGRLTNLKDVIRDKWSINTVKKFFTDRWNLHKAVNHLKSSAQQGYAEAQYDLSFNYYYGYGVSRNIARGDVWLVKSANNGHSDALCDLGFKYFLGRSSSFPKNVEKAISLEEKAFKKGNSRAGYFLICLYHTGRTVDKDNKKAFEYAIALAKMNNSDAQDYLGSAYTRGWGVKRNYQKALEWFEKSIDNYNSRAMYHLAYMRYHGLGCKKDYKETLKLIDKLNKRGGLGGMLFLARLNWEGKAVPKNLEKAEELYRKVLKTKQEWGLNGLAYMYAQEGIKLDEAEKMAKKALKLKPDESCIFDTLGWVYYKQKRYKEAVEALEKSVELEGLIENLDHLGDAYFALGEKEKAQEQWRKAHKLCQGYYLSDKIQEKLNK
jgi:TPR repeat protein